MYKGNYEGLHRRIKMNRDNFIYAAIITGSLDLIRDLPEGDEIDMCEGMERMAEGFRNEGRMQGREQGILVGRSEGKLEEKRSTLKEQLEIKPSFLLLSWNIYYYICRGWLRSNYVKFEAPRLFI